MIALIGLLLAAAPAKAANCRNPQQQSEMTFCAGEAWRQADAELNRVWLRLKAVMQKMDAQEVQASSCYPAASNNGKCLGYVGALVNAQRDWISFRDAECVVGGYASRGGSMEPMLVFQCRENLTRKRIKELNDTIDDFTKEH